MRGKAVLPVSGRGANADWAVIIGLLSGASRARIRKELETIHYKSGSLKDLGEKKSSH